MAEASTQRVALVTGANRGLGFETARQLAGRGYKTILTSRDGLAGKAAADKLQSEGLDVAHQPLDVTREDSIRRLAEFLDNAFGGLHVLINNAGIQPEADVDHPQAASVFSSQLDNLRAAAETNVFGPLMLCQKLVPLMRRQHYGRIVNVSTGMAQLSDMGGGYPAYRLSKTALNALTRILAAETRGENILVNAVCPGWVKTRMGGPNANRSPAEAVAGIIWAATLDENGPSGGFFRDGEPIPW